MAPVAVHIASKRAREHIIAPEQRYPRRSLRYPIIDPMLLHIRLRLQPLEVFLCGPGYNHSAYATRKRLRKYLTGFGAMTIHYGEDLENLHIPQRKRSIDLQTLEAIYANRVDFTVLLVDSPGAIAELGSFTMVNSLRPRLFAVVPEAYYNSTSYIARGPLSILADYGSRNVVYLDFGVKNPLLAPLNFPVTFFKFVHGIDRNTYRLLSRYESERDKYYDYITARRDDFLSRIALLGIVLLDKPSFTSLTEWLHLSPREINAALRVLYDCKSIRKVAAGRYEAVDGFSDNLLQCFDTSRASKRRAEILAANR